MSSHQNHRHRPLSAVNLAAFTLLSSLASVSGGKTYMSTKTFHFKHEFFLKFANLDTASAPGDDKDHLLASLKNYAKTFRDEWREALEDELEDGKCEVTVRHV